jgi:hypothetical protein
MDKVNTFISNIINTFDQWMLNPYFATTITIILTVYASLASPNLPNFLKKLFDNSIFKILIISFIAYRANKNPQLSLLVAVCFVITLNFLAEKENKEAFEQIETFNQLEYFSNTLDTTGNIESSNLELSEPPNPEPSNLNNTDSDSSGIKSDSSNIKSDSSNIKSDSSDINSETKSNSSETKSETKSDSSDINSDTKSNSSDINSDSSDIKYDSSDTKSDSSESKKN